MWVVDRLALGSALLYKILMFLGLVLFNLFV